MNKLFGLLTGVTLLGCIPFFPAQQRPVLASHIPEGYELVWSDEFKGTTLDKSKWDHRRLGRHLGAVNDRNAVTLDGKGHLVITTRRKGNAYHTGMIGTEGKFETKYGYFECRVKLQKEVGHHSAFWLFAPTIGKILGNPAKAGAEIDVFEYLKRKGDTVQHTIHWDGYKKENHKYVVSKPRIPGVSKGWHTFGLLWTEKEYVFYVNGKETWRTRQSVSQRSQYMILSLAITQWSGDISKAKLPDSFYVDYVRVYQKR